LEEALSYGSNTFMFYTGAPQNTRRYDIDDDKTKEALSIMKEHGMDYSNVIVHAPYIINLASSDDEKRNFAVSFLKQEVDRCDKLGIKYMVLHPGAAVGLDRTEAMDNIIRGLNNILVKDDTTIVLLETMAGKGTELGINLEEVSYLLNGIELKDKVGVCLDTCHLSDSGVDISKFDEYLDEFDKLIGINKIGCVHVNDSKNPIGSHKDRHENLGYGSIGFDNLINVIYNERLANIPKILETPYVDKEYAPYKQEIDMIKSKTFNPNLYNDVIKYYSK
jgi:deoxyribonuclease-4